VTYPVGRSLIFKVASSNWGERLTSLRQGLRSWGGNEGEGDALQDASKLLLLLRGKDDWITSVGSHFV